MPYHILMFSITSCAHPSCQKSALSYYDADKDSLLTHEYCYEHSPKAAEITNSLYEYIASHDKIVGMNASGISFANMDLSGKRFYGCKFLYCTFMNIHSEQLRVRMSMFDFSMFSDCNLLQSNMQFTSFAGSTFSHVLFTNSDLVHNNFCGITAYQSSFDDSDLYNSRFIRAVLNNTSLRNCNIKKTAFYEITQDNVSFKLSNTREALFSPEAAE